MRLLLTLATLALLATAAAQSQAVDAKQAHSLLDGIVMGSREAIDRAQVDVASTIALPGGMALRVIEMTEGGNRSTYVASYDADGGLVDGMLVATDGDVRRLRAEADNEYVWFVPQGPAVCTATTDSVFVRRRYNMEMKPVGDSYIRHCCTATSRYAIRADGTFEQLPMAIVNQQIEGPLDAQGRELPPTSQREVRPSLNAQSAAVMQLLHSPISMAPAAMEQWLALGHHLIDRMQMTGVPDCELWATSYYANHIAPMLSQGDGRKMVWFDGYHNLAGYISATDTDHTLHNVLLQSAKRLSDKKARKWWEKVLK